MTQTRFEEGPRCWIDWLTGRAQHILHKRQSLDGQLWAIAHLFALPRFATNLRWPCNDDVLGDRCAHHLVGDAVRLLLKGIVHRSDNELRLHDASRSDAAARRKLLRSVGPLGWENWGLAEIPCHTQHCRSIERFGFWHGCVAGASSFRARTSLRWKPRCRQVTVPARCHTRARRGLERHLGARTRCALGLRLCDWRRKHATHPSWAKMARRPYSKDDLRLYSLRDKTIGGRQRLLPTRNGYFVRSRPQRPDVFRSL